MQGHLYDIIKSEIVPGILWRMEILNLACDAYRHYMVSVALQTALTLYGLCFTSFLYILIEAFVSVAEKNVTGLLNFSVHMYVRWCKVVEATCHPSGVAGIVSSYYIFFCSHFTVVVCFWICLNLKTTIQWIFGWAPPCHLVSTLVTNLSSRSRSFTGFLLVPKVQQLAEKSRFGCQMVLLRWWKMMIVIRWFGALYYNVFCFWYSSRVGGSWDGSTSQNSGTW